MEDHIFGYSLIKHLVTSTNDSNIFDTSMSAFTHISSEGAETVVLIIQKFAEIRSRSWKYELVDKI